MVLGMQSPPAHPLSNLLRAAAASQSIASPGALQLYGSNSSIARALASDKIQVLDEIVPNLTTFAAQHGLHISDAVRGFMTLCNFQTKRFEEYYSPSFQAIELVYQRIVEAVARTDLSAFVDSAAFLEYLVEDTVARFRVSATALGQTQNERLEAEATVLRIFAEISQQNPSSLLLAQILYEAFRDFANKLASLSDTSLSATDDPFDITTEAILVSSMAGWEKQKCFRKLTEAKRDVNHGFGRRRRSPLGPLDHRGRELNRLTHEGGRRSSSPSEFASTPVLLGPMHRRCRSLSRGHWSGSEIRHQAHKVIRAAEDMKDHAKKLERMVDW